MTITAIAFSNSGVDVAVDADLRALHPNLPDDIWSGRESYRDTLEAAFNQLILDLKKAGWTTTLINNSTANIEWFHAVVTVGALIMIFRDFRGETGDRWDLLLTDYERKYQTYVADAKLDYDTDEDGTVDEDEEGTKLGVTLLR